MAHNEERYSTPRSAVGFAVAFTFALATMWLAGLVVEVRSYASLAPYQASAQVVQTSCTSDAAPCRLPAEH